MADETTSSERGDLTAGRAMTRRDRVIYWFFRSLIVVVGTVLFRVRVYGRENIPAEGACILAPIHRSNLDTPILGFVTKRRMRFMGKDSMWKPKLGNVFLTALGGFPVARGTADREALRACEAVVARGEPLVMFPEGTRQRGPEVHPLFDGPAFVSCRSGAPLIPIGIGGSERVMPKGAKLIRPKKIVIVVGSPVRPPVFDGRVPRRAIKELTDQLTVELQQVFDDADHRAGAR